MRKVQRKREWTAKQKAEKVHKHLDNHISVRTLEKEYDADRRNRSMGKGVDAHGTKKRVFLSNRIA